MSVRLPELSYRLAHHLPEALPFIIPFYHKLRDSGFDIDERKIKPVLRRNGFRIVVNYERNNQGVIVVFYLYGKKEQPIITVNLNELLQGFHRIHSVRDYADIDRRIDQVVTALINVTT